MPTNPNMVAIQTVTVGSGGASSISFTSIPQTYTDLVLKLSTRTTENPGPSALGLQINGASTSLNVTALRGNGAAASSFTLATTSGGFARYSGQSGQASDTTASTFSNQEIYIPNYTSANFKSMSLDSVTENNGTTAYAELNAILWSSTSAITSLAVNVYGGGGSFVQYSTATLYGVTAFVGETGGKAIGGTVTSDANYWYHTFTTSGMFTPTQNITCDYLVVAGGGGSGTVYGGGGGAGGLRCTVGATGGGGALESALSLTANTGYMVLVGGGGAGATAGGTWPRGTAGSNSVFSTISSTGGGGGGSSQGSNTAGGTGGSGGGGSTSLGANGGSGTANQGYAGGNSSTSGNFGSGGGGGAGAAGSNGSSSAGGNGGNGVATSISGSSVTYAGGGGGATFQGGTAGSGGSGGGGAGGAGGTDNQGTAGTANRGGGAGGTAYQNSVSVNGANGGSGIVIVRYAK
jgi:hypothetical protein